MPSPGSIVVDPLLKERGDMMRIAARPGRTERQALNPAVDPIKGERQPPRPGPLARQARNEILGQPFGSECQIGGIGDRLGETQPDPSRGCFAQRRQRLGQIIKCLVEALRHGFAKAACQGRARHRIKIADPL